MTKRITFINNLTLPALLLAGFVFFPHMAWAQAIDTVFDGMGQAVSPLPKAIVAGSYMLGLIALIVGLMKLKDSVDEPAKNKIQSGAMALAVGVLLIALPKAIELGRSLSGAETEAVAAPKMIQGTSIGRN